MLLVLGATRLYSVCENETVLVWVLLLLFLLPVAAATETGSAIDRLQHLRTALRATHKANDWRSNLATANEQKKFLNESPNSLLEVARGEVQLGKFSAAFRELGRFADMGQSTDLVTTHPDFKLLRERTGFAKLQRRMKANQSPMAVSSTAFLLADPALLAEDVDYDPLTKQFFVTSVREKKVISVNASGESLVDFARAPDQWPMLAVKVDSERRLLWATEVAMRGFTSVSESDWGRSAVLCFDLKDGRLLRRIEGPRGTALGDMVLDTRGGVILSDSEGGGLYLLPLNAKAVERIDDGDFISPQTPAMHPDGRHIFIPDYVRGIGLLDISTKRVRWLAMRGRFALSGIDGLYFNNGRLIAVQNGTSPERVVAFTLDGTGTRIVAEEIIERSTETLGDPTHGTMVGGEFWYIANSGWDATDDQGNFKPGVKPSPPRIMRAGF